MPQSSSIVWCDAEGQGRNAFALFRRELDFPTPPARCLLSLFADSRYRLRVNGLIVANGPARFVPQAPEFDTVDLAPYLQPGPNVVAVEVNAYGAPSFQTMPGGRGGFLARGTVLLPDGESVSFDTPGDWRCIRSDAWDPQAHSFSFAQGPVEILDRRRLPPGWDLPGFDDSTWERPVPAGSDAPWGELQPRSVPPLSRELMLPFSTRMVAAVAEDELRLGVRICEPRCARHRIRDLPEPLRFAYAACIYSPEARDVVLGLFWGPHYLNGTPLHCSDDDLRGGRQNAEARLQPGWNLLYGEPEVLNDVWGLLIGIPVFPGLMVRARPDAADGNAIRHTAAMPASELQRARSEPPAASDDADAMQVDWQAVPRDAIPPYPAREFAWDRPGEASPVDSTRIADILIDTGRAGTHTMLVDFDAEFLGHPLVELDAPEGTIVDFAVEERLRADGMVSVAKRHFTDTADRIICRGGGEELEGFHVRGGRYLQLTFRLPRRGEPLRIRRIGVRRAQIPLDVRGDFRSPDPVFNRTWALGRDTLQACTEDAYLDCPWRERGTYIGDGYVEMHVHRCLSHDLAVARRCLGLWARAARPDGQLLACAPSAVGHPHEDFSLIWILMLHDWFALTGDAALVRDLWPALEGIIASSCWRESASGLWDAEGLKLFVDWGATPESAAGRENAILNALRYRALTCAAYLSRAVNRGDPDTLAAGAESVRVAFNDRLWREEDGCFAPCRNAEGTFADTSGVHANVMALYCGLASPDWEVRVMEFLEPQLEANLGRMLRGEQRAGFLELYFLFYALEVLYRTGRAPLAERIIRETYGTMLAKGARTAWECMHRGVFGQGSLCHAWSCAPTVMFANHTLGIRQAVPGRTDRFLVCPDSELEWAEGTYPHPDGDIRIAWRRTGETVRVAVEAPGSVHIEIGPPPRCPERRFVRVNAAETGVRVH